MSDGILYSKQRTAELRYKFPPSSITLQY